MTYHKPTRYAEEELRAAALSDLESDARQAEDQAANGPFYPERGVTGESLREYAEQCRTRISEISTKVPS